MPATAQPELESAGLPLKAMTALLKCSFCGKSEKEVDKLVAGPGVYICDACVELCNQVIAEASTPC